jgi:hypothetical protein
MSMVIKGALRMLPNDAGNAVVVTESSFEGDTSGKGFC